MSYDLYIDYGSDGEKIALLKDNQLIELHTEQAGQRFNVGDVYLGKIKKLMPSLNAAFVDVGYEKDAFLHYSDVGPNIRSLQKMFRSTRQGGQKEYDLSNFKLEAETLKTGNITDVFKKDQEILVQVTKEPISSKGPRLSTEMVIPGKYVILVPFANSISISKKIGSSEERTRIKNLTLSLKPKNFGIICRTAAEGKNAAELHKDIVELLQRWETVFANLKEAKVYQKLMGEGNRYHSVLRDLLSLDFNSITVNSEEVYKKLKEQYSGSGEDLAKVLKVYKGKERLFQHFGIEKQIKASFGKNVPILGGAYLVVEHTEALHVIDVNSGSNKPSAGSQEEQALKVNLAAAEEIARQLRLRDMGGIIVIDFIDLKNNTYKKQLHDALAEAMKSDRAKHTILPMSKFGLIQITRQRVRPEMNIITSEVCPSCSGTGRIQASILLEDEIENHLGNIVRQLNPSKIELVAHPYVASFFKKGLWSKRLAWMYKYRRMIKVTPDPSFHYTEFRFFDQHEEEINLN